MQGTELMSPQYQIMPDLPTRSLLALGKLDSLFSGSGTSGSSLFALSRSAVLALDQSASPFKLDLFCNCQRREYRHTLDDTIDDTGHDVLIMMGGLLWKSNGN